IADELRRTEEEILARKQRLAALERERDVFSVRVSERLFEYVPQSAEAHHAVGRRLALLRKRMVETVGAPHVAKRRGGLEHYGDRRHQSVPLRSDFISARKSSSTARIASPVSG